MVCELFLLSCVSFFFAIFWMETLSIWLFLCNFYQDRAFYHWGDGIIFADNPGHMLNMLGRWTQLNASLRHDRDVNDETLAEDVLFVQTTGFYCKPLS